MYKDQIITDESTCVSLNIKEGDKIVSISGAPSKSGYIIWWRVKILSVSMTSGWYMSDSKWDALTFRPKRKIRLLGSGVFGPVGNPCEVPHGWKLEF